MEKLGILICVSGCNIKKSILVTYLFQGVSIENG